MKTIAASKFRAQFTELLHDLSTGPVEVTKHGKVVAILTSPDSPVEAIEAAETATDASETPEPITSPPEPLEAVSEADEEDFLRLDEEESEEWSQDEEMAFEAFLSSREPDYHPVS